MGRIGQLMLGILAIGLAIGFLREAAPGWDTAASVVAWSVVLLAAIGTTRGSRRRRAGRLAFALSGTALLLLINLSSVRAWPPLERGLDRLHPRLCRPREHVAALPRDQFDEAFSAWSAAHPEADDMTLGISMEDGSPGTMETMYVRWKTPTREAFQHNGLTIAALLVAGMIGMAAGGVSRRVSGDGRER